MKNLLHFVFIMLTCMVAVGQQPPICGDDPLMTPTCQEACIICDIDGYSGNNNSTVSGVGPDDFCTFVQHNIQWIGFIATSENLTLEVAVSNCVGGPGLEIAIYEALDCSDPTLVSNCLGGMNGGQIPDGSSGFISNTVPLVIGQYYYFVMDGNLGAVCDYTVSVTEGSTMVPPLEPIEEMYGEDEVCTGGSLSFYIDEIIGAPNIVWFIDGVEIGTGDSINVDFPTEGIYEICVEASNICSDPVTFCKNITVTTLSPGSVVDSTCNGQCITILNQDFCEPGEYEILTQTAEGCDSLIEITILEIPPKMTMVDTQICALEIVVIGSDAFFETGIYEVNLLSSAGCDSIVTLDLDVIPISETDISAEVCVNESFSVGDSILDYSGLFTIILTSPDGCDSIVYLDLVVQDSINTYLDIQICQGQFYEAGGLIFDESGSYEIPLISSLGCDSMVFLDLMVVDTIFTLLNPTICHGESFASGDSVFTESGSYTLHLFSQAGCDSFVSIDLTILDSIQTNFIATICVGDTMVVGDSIITSSGSYTIVLESNLGCDSFVNVDLSIQDTIYGFANVQICANDTFEIDTFSFFNNGTYQLPFISTMGCDSILNLTVEIIDTIYTNITAFICRDSLLTFGDSIFNSSGVFEIPFTSHAGCDSIVILEINIIEPIYTNIISTICDGDTLSIGNQQLTTSGDFEINFKSSMGCDSIILLNLSVQEVVTTNITQSICSGDSVIVGDSVIFDDGLHQINLISSNGCDSIVFLDLELIQPVIVNQRSHLCAGYTIEVGGESFAETGIYNIELTAASGCDSLVILDLIVLDTPNLILDVNICQGDTFFIDRDFYTEAGTHKIVYVTNARCDSTVVINLQTMQCAIEGDISADSAICAGSATGALNITAVEGRAPFTFDWERIPSGMPSGNGTIENIGDTEVVQSLPAGNYQVTLTDLRGAIDIMSIEIGQPQELDLTLTPSDFDGFGVSCFGEENGFINTSVSGGSPPYTYQWQNDNNDPSLTNIGAGSYTLTVTDANGCQIDDEAILNEPDVLSLLFNIIQPDCDNTNGTLIINEIIGGIPEYEITLNGENTNVNQTIDLPPGIYDIDISDNQNCQISSSFELIEVPTFFLINASDVTNTYGDSVQLTPTFNLPVDSIVWIGNGLSCNNCINPWASPSVTTTYQFTAYSVDGCPSTGFITVEVEINADVYIPTAFTPNDDGINDRLIVYGGDGIRQVLSFEIFSRWGNKVFERNNFPVNDPEYGWNGKFNDKEMDAAVFVYTVEVEVVDGSRFFLKGDFTLIR